MLPKRSTVDPDGPLASAIAILEELGRQPEAAEIRRLLAEWLYAREEAARVREEAARTREEAARTREEAARTREEAASSAQNVLEARNVARENLGRWRNLALIQQSRQELARCDETLRKYPWIRAAA